MPLYASGATGCYQLIVIMSSVDSASALSGQDLHLQILHLKEKAHQSFMQVIQMQELHQQELEGLLEEHHQSTAQFQAQVEGLELRVRQLEYENAVLEKNSKHHNCEVEGDSLVIDSVECIACRDEPSRLDDSAISALRELIAPTQEQERVAILREQIRKQLVVLVGDEAGLGRVSDMLDKVFDYLTVIRREHAALHENYLQVREQCDEAFSREKTARSEVESLQKEGRFMGENIRRLTSDKIRAEKQLGEAEKHSSGLQRTIDALEQGLERKGMTLEGVLGSRNKHLLPKKDESSLDLNDFIQENLVRQQSLAPKREPALGNIRKQSSQLSRNR